MYYQGIVNCFSGCDDSVDVLITVLYGIRCTVVCYWVVADFKKIVRFFVSDSIGPREHASHSQSMVVERGGVGGDGNWGVWLERHEEFKLHASLSSQLNFSCFFCWVLYHPSFL